MPLVLPFRALRPAPGRAAEILAPPYDVLTSAEARERAAGKPWSFLHVSKPEIDLDPATDPYDSAVYAKGAENLQRMIADGVLRRDATDAYYVYRLTWRGRTQTGVAGVASIADYLCNRIRKHELTTPSQGRRPRAPDGGARRPDRPGHDGLSGRARHRRHAGRGDPTGARSRRHRRWRSATSSG